MTTADTIHSFRRLLPKKLSIGLCVEIFLHLLFWVFYFSVLNVNWSGNWLDRDAHMTGVSAVSAVLFPLSFYLNAFWLVPNFLNSKKWYLYFLITFSLLLVIEFFRAYLFMQFSTTPVTFYKEIFGRHSIFLSPPNSLFFAFIFSFAYRFTRDWLINGRRIAQLEQDKTTLELHLLKAQLNPHFLFNNLNALDDLIDTDKAAAKKYLHQLSALFRYFIVNTNADLVSLQQEWDVLDNYLFLLKERFGAAYDFEKSTSQMDMNRYFIPPASLQTLVENAVKHNAGLENDPLIISISANENAVTISHLKRPKNTPSISLGTGLKNLKLRYKLLSKQKLQITDAESYTVTLPLIKEVA